MIANPRHEKQHRTGKGDILKLWKGNLIITGQNKSGLKRK